MKAHIVGSGLASLATAVLLIREGHFLASNVTIYEAGAHLGGAMAKFGGPASGYILPTGRVFEKEYRCTFDLFSSIPSTSDPSISIKEEIESFNRRFGYFDKAHVIASSGEVVKSAHFGLSLQDRFNLLKLMLTPESMLEGKCISEYFAPGFFRSEFWFLWAPVMGCLPQHSAIEMRRFLYRFLHLLPDLSEMTMILRTRFDQYETIVQPIVSWLRNQGAEVLPGANVVDVGFIPSRIELTANSLRYLRESKSVTVEVAPHDLVFVTAGSQVANLSIGDTKSAPKPHSMPNSWALWEKLAKGRTVFGNPAKFFGEEHVKDTKWLTFTVTTADPAFLDMMEDFTGSEPGRGGIMTFKDSNWLLSVAIFHQPEFTDQPEGVYVWWGFAICPDKPGNLVPKPATECTGREILDEVLFHLKFQENRARILDASFCIPCILPYAGSVWLVRNQADRPRVVPEGSTNFAFLGQFAEVADETIFTMEYSVRSAYEAVSKLLKLKDGPPPIYQGHRDPAVLAEVLRKLS